MAQVDAFEVVRSVFHHFCDNAASVPSSCMSVTILLTASSNVVCETGAFLSSAMLSGS